MYKREITAKPCWQFEADVVVLFHCTTIRLDSNSRRCSASR
jgi:GTPase